MHKRTQDAMTYVRHYGLPDLFITFTYNPTWDEVKELFDGQTYNDRHNLSARVFRQKVIRLIEVIKSARYLAHCDVTCTPLSDKSGDFPMLTFSSG